MAKKKNKLVSGYFDATTDSFVTDANIEEDEKGFRIVKSNNIAPAPSVNNNRNTTNSSFISGLMNTQNDVFSKVMTFQNQQPSILDEDNSLDGYKDTGKKYGDYYYENYGLFKDTPIYVKNNKYYVNTNGSYQQLGNLDKNGNVITGNVMTSKEAEKQKLEEAKKLGYKDNSFKVTSQEYDDIQSSFKKLKKEYKLSDKELKDFIDNGNLTTKHIRIQDKESDKIRREAIESREKLASGKVKQYSDKGLRISDRIYMDTHDMSDDDKTKYINYITGKRQPEDENKSSFFKASDVWKDGYDFGDVTKTIVGTRLNPLYSMTKGMSNFVEGTSDALSNVVGTGLEKVGSVGNKKQDVTETKDGKSYIGYRYGNKNYWYDKKSDRMYDENWNELESFNLDTFQKRYTNTNKVAEFGRQMKEQAANDDTSEVMETIGKPIKKASILGDKSNAMFESLGQALPLMAAGNSAGGLLGEKAAVATTSALTFANTYGSAKTQAIRNGASETDAVKSAFIQAAAETISEQFFDSIPGAKSAGWGEKAVGKISSGVEKYFGTQTGKVVAKTLDISGEGFEEIISNMITAGGNDIFHAFDKNFNYGMEGQTRNIAKDMANAMLSQDSVDSFVCAIITSAILNGGSAKLNNAQMNNIVSTYAKENNISVNEAKARLDLENNEQNAPNLPTENAIEQQNVVNNINNQVNDNVQNNMPTIENNTQEKYSNIKPPTIIKYQATDNEKINSFRQSAVKEGMINSKKTTNAMNVIEKVIEDKNYNVKFDRTITNLNGKSVDGKININKNGEVEIALNPNSDRAVEFLLTHEVTHAIETKELRGIILDYANKNPEFKSALKDLQKTYNTENVNDEVVADISAQILGNQEFINSLSAQNTPQSRNIIKNIYESIKRVLNNFTSKGRYRNFVQDLETKWRDAYRLATNETTKNNLQKIEKYSMQSKENNTQELDNSSFSLKEKQLEIIKKENPMLDDYHTGIRTIDDIKTPEEAFKTKIDEDEDYSYPDFTQEDGEKALESGKITVYSSKEIKQGTFVSPSKSMVQDYAGDGKIFEQTISINDVAWINSDEGQYAKIVSNDNNTINEPKLSQDNKGRTLSKEQQEYFKDSKIRNENGNLKVMYHGTKNGGFTIFDRNKAKTSGNFGTGIYFSSTMDYSNDYIDKSSNSKMYEVYLNITNPVDSVNKSRTLTNEQVKKLVETIANNEDYGIENYGYNATIDSVTNDLIQHNNDFEIFQDLDITCVGNFAELVELANKTIGTTFDGINTPLETVAFYPNQIKNVDNTNPTTNDDIRYSQKAPTWQEHLEKNYKAIGTRTYFDEMTNTTKKAIAPISNEVKKISNEIKELKKEISERKIPIAKEYQKNTIDEKIENDDNYLKVDSVRDLDPIQISNIKESDASTTPKLPNVRRNGPFANKESSFYKNSTKKSEFLTENSRDIISKEDDVRFYKGITNEDTLEEAYNKLQRGGKSETMKWFSKDSKDATAVDVAQGWILLKHYQDSGDYDSMVEVAKKMREIGTTSGQTVQAFNILARLTPEGMVKYAQSELTEAYNKMVENKTKNWIDKHQQDFDLTSDEVQFIIDTMKDVQNMEDGYDKRVKLAEIQKLMTDKLPTERGRKIKSWMRISMLFNPKTQVRNVMGNAIIAPINYFGDIFASAADKMIAKKTGIRTTGIANVKSILKGLKEGAYQATNDYKKGINTRDMEGNRFEIGEGKSFSDKNLIGKNLNRVDRLLNYVMDVGDRVFSQSSFENSLQNQMKLNNTTKITQDMIDIARSESLQRTWNDNNNYTKFVLGVRRGLNKIGIKGYGLGDVLIPFAKTPANLTKAIVDYSPIGLMQSIGNGINLKRSLTNGQYNSKMQHHFVQNLGKATAGTMLYVIGYALAKAKITTGESDDDKDVASFMKNTLGTNSYSIKIGNKSFTYDWAQPLAAPLSITANIVNKKYKSKDLKEFTETVIDSLDTGGSILLEQSFLQSINDVLKNNDGVVSGLVNEVLELPARAIPTFSKQIADMTDSTQRQTYVKGEPVETALNSAKAKIPFVSKTLTPSVDTMGRNIKKYGGKNNAFNVLFNPANVNNENISSAAKEIYKVYNATDDKTIFPRVAPYSIDKLPLSTKQRADYQKIGGELIEKSINELIKNDDYKDLSNKDKAVVISKIVGYNSAKAKSKVLKTKMSRYWNSVNRYLDKGGTVAEYYLYKVVDD